MPAHPDLIAHSAEFTRRVVRLAPGLYGFVGFAASNVYALEGPSSVAIIDTTESTAAAEAILAELQALTSKPIATILYTHSHRDHISGAQVFADAAPAPPEVIAWHSFSSDLVGAERGPAKALQARTRRQFGMGLSFPDERVNLGLGPGDRPMRGLGAGHVAPNVAINSDRTEGLLAGVEVELIHAPGETPDHLLVWLPQERALISGDNFYHAFPNLYPIRGSAYRDFEAWADSLDRMLDFGAAILGPGHAQPVIGADAIRERLATTRDAIRHIIAATVDGMNAGVGIDQIAAEVTLPPALADKPWLQPFYGRVDWAVRAYATGTLGWFDGNPTNLGRLSPVDEAHRMIALAGGADALLAAARDSDDPQWTLELSVRLLAAGAHVDAAQTIRIAALRTLADRQINATARNYYLVSAQELEGNDAA